MARLTASSTGRWAAVHVWRWIKRSRCTSLPCVPNVRTASRSPMGSCTGGPCPATVSSTSTVSPVWDRPRTSTFMPRRLRRNDCRKGLPTARNSRRRQPPRPTGPPSAPIIWRWRPTKPSCLKNPKNSGTACRKSPSVRPPRPSSMGVSTWGDRTGPFIAWTRRPERSVGEPTPAVPFASHRPFGRDASSSAPVMGGPTRLTQQPAN